MELVHVKEVLSLLNRAHLFTIQNEEDGSLQHAIEGIINMVEGIITICSKKQTSFFSSLSVFYNMFMLYWSPRVKSVLVLNRAYFLTLFCQKMSTYLDRAKEKVKNLKTDNFDQTSENRTPPNSGQF